MRYIIPSVGRCGSTIMTECVAKASGKKQSFVNKPSDLRSIDERTLKTHLHFPGELPPDYKVVYMYDDTAAVIATLYRLRFFPDKWFRNHLCNLGVRKLLIKVFLSGKAEQTDGVYLFDGWS